jgi:4-hydroxy-3-methylbut-2-enyl diphosphate reductase
VTTPGPRASVGTALLLDGRAPAGNLLVATELVTEGGARSAPLRGADLLARDLCRAGLPVSTGPLLLRAAPGADGPAWAPRSGGGRAQPALAADGPGWFPPGDEGPLAVLRALTADAHGGEKGNDEVAQLLGRAGPSLERWRDAVGPHEVRLAAPRSFCAGVERAINIVERALERFGPPVYVRRQIVHNAHVVASLERRGAVFVQELDEVPDGATAILAAHGVSPAVRDEALERGTLTLIDATCPLVAKVHLQARRYAGLGHQLVLIGHREHEEVVGTMAEVPGRIDLVERTEDIGDLALDQSAPITYLTQTTLATDETADIVDALRARYPHVEGPPASDICYATQNRQDAVRALAPDCDVLLVVGSTNSSNAARLREVARRLGCRAEQLEDAGELELAWLARSPVIGVTAGASTPELLVEELIDSLRTLGPLEVTEHSVTEERTRFPLPPQVR